MSRTCNLYEHLSVQMERAQNNVMLNNLDTLVLALDSCRDYMEKIHESSALCSLENTPQLRALVLSLLE